MKDDNNHMNLITFIVIGNLTLLLILFPPKNFLDYELVKSISITILFTTYYILLIKILEYYISKISPYLTEKIRKHPLATKRILVISGIIMLFFGLNYFMGFYETLKVYGVGIVTYLLSLLSQLKKE